MVSISFVWQFDDECAKGAAGPMGEVQVCIKFANRE